MWDNPGNARHGSASYVNPVPPRAKDGTFRSGPVAFQYTGLQRLSSDASKNLAEIEQKRREGAQRLASDALAYMQTHAPWKDRTGQARQTLMATVVDDDEGHISQVYLGYGVFYGKFLEEKTYKGVSYAIIRPTVAYFRDRVASYLT